ncbi:hypothetical protein ACFVZR_10985 [Streptomyces sp. NPDC058316]|uniref:hypothetical protein n=1 Tax=unclassified Streptomyces TaxID=2593676 RepID=UPI0036E98F27
MMRQHIRLSAVLVVVVLALTGFSTSSHGGRSGKSRGSSGSGGGCSNSEKSNGGYHHSDYDDNDDNGSSSGSSSGNQATPPPSLTAAEEPQVSVIRCARPRKGKRKAVTFSTVRLMANAAGSHTYEVDVQFLDALGNLVTTGDADVDAEDGETTTVTVRMESPSKVSEVAKCEVDAELSH